jgi:molybdopterin-guanine dinucleotide biosynthesis protein A
MLGIVLCGGKSSRMGSDKGLLLSTGGTWAKKMLGNLRELGIVSALSVNNSQFEQYAALFPNTKLIKDSDLILLKGPLAAVLSVHAEYPLEDLFITACDMPLMDTIVLKELYNNYLKDSGKDCFVFTNDGEPEPLCGIYSARGLTKIKTMYDGGQLVRHSMKFLLDHLITSLIPIPGNWKIYFKNFNAHADLNGL